MRHQAAPKFTSGQPVVLHFTPAMGEPYTVDAVVIENCDAVCRPLTDMWTVRMETGFTCGFSGKAITPRRVA